LTRSRILAKQHEIKLSKIMKTEKKEKKNEYIKERELSQKEG
jgi:hypothetical protein